MKKYLTRDYSDKIELVDVERETSESVWIGGRRHAKVSSWKVFHDTFESAQQKLIDRREGEIRIARDQIRRAESALGTIRKLTEADAKPAR